MNNRVMRFSLALNDAMRDSRVGAKALQDQLIEMGVTNITRQRISEYLHAVSTPPFKKARILMDALGYDISDEELEDSLELNRQLIREEKEILDLNEYRRSAIIRLRYRKIYPGKNALEAEQLLRDRATQLFGAEDTLTKYIEYLVCNDLRNSDERSN